MMIFSLLHERAVVMHIIFAALHTYAIPFDALNGEDAVELLGLYLMSEN